MINTALNKILQQDFDLPIGDKTTEAETKNILANYINELIQRDFNRLIFLLYKVDVSEEKLKQLLKEQSQQDTGRIIAALIIERQQQKINSRKNFDTNNEINGEEKW